MTITHPYPNATFQPVVGERLYRVSLPFVTNGRKEIVVEQFLIIHRTATTLMIELETADDRPRIAQTVKLSYVGHIYFYSPLDAVVHMMNSNTQSIIGYHEQIESLTNRNVELSALCAQIEGESMDPETLIRLLDSGAIEEVYVASTIFVGSGKSFVLARKAAVLEMLKEKEKHAVVRAQLGGASASKLYLG